MDSKKRNNQLVCARVQWHARYSVSVVLVAVWMNDSQEKSVFLQFGRKNNEVSTGWLHRTVNYSSLNSSLFCLVSQGSPLKHCTRHRGRLVLASQQRQTGSPLPFLAEWFVIPIIVHPSVSVAMTTQETNWTRIVHTSPTVELKYIRHRLILSIVITNICVGLLTNVLSRKAICSLSLSCLSVAVQMSISMLQ